ncbi:helix-turn-helix domain-containing protein [[Clostridium] scindens]|uniref:helix-turn-helix domain-containing protein n=1 Tax=Clostridium scindens (strain JCM 10418 / VPI 12708) TaxID=29347 RepID=UPI00248E043C|nr:helix-turn-helix transcriptional regulator [[Clostridium] scindens]
MLNRQDLEKFRITRGLSYREVANYCNISHTMISEVEKGTKGLTKETHDEIVKGINLAYQAKVNGTLQAKNTKKVAKSDNKNISSETESKAEVKKTTTKKNTIKSTN